MSCKEFSCNSVTTFTTALSFVYSYLASAIAGFFMFLNKTIYKIMITLSIKLNHIVIDISKFIYKYSV